MMLSSTERGAFKHQQLSSKTLHNDLLGAESQQQLPQGTFHCKVNPYDNTDKPQRVRRHTLGDSGKEKASFYHSLRGDTYIFIQENLHGNSKDVAVWWCSGGS